MSLRRKVSMRTVYVPVAIATALLSGLYYLLKVRQECGPLPLMACVQQAFTAGSGARVAEDARQAAERYERERTDAEQRKRNDEMQKAVVRPGDDSPKTTMVWKVKSMYQYRVQIAFYSRDRNHEWPGNGEAWDLNDYNDHTYTLNCRQSEKICFGAWVTGNASKYWGVGFGGKQACGNCCFLCGQQPQPQTLQP